MRVSVQCPACWQTIELAIDPDEGAGEFYEDCSVCCAPMRVLLQPSDDEGELSVQVEPGND